MRTYACTYLRVPSASTIDPVQQLLVVPRAELDLSQFPVVVLSECGVLSDEERVCVMEALESLIERRGRHALVLDLTQAGVLPQVQCVYVTEALQQRSVQIAENWAAVAIVVQLPFSVGLPRAAFWLKVSPVPSRMFADREEPVTWARGRVRLESTGAMPITALTETKRRSDG